MNIPTIIAVVIVAVIFIAIIVRQIKKMKSGACSCDCAVCGGCCKSGCSGKKDEE
ncbi:MAG: FeoB-associated Cys-rich membrane protein [Oscillospiraceae bacterium]|nr:FeoB-associated Cys-rich membrane protein [Oscillospiraceae bacterium]